jgi:hypothetical protein
MRISRIAPALVLILVPVALHAQAAQTKESETEFVKAAEEGAPEHISSKATIARLEPKGKSTIMRQGSNGFTCTLFPDESHAPLCADDKGWRWFVAAISGQPRPPSTGGVGYMAKGGLHYEKPNGQIVMMPAADTKSVKEPPHWMLLTPFDSATTGIPTRPNAGGTYIMFAGTPYAHLMIYQDPKMLFKQ